MKVGDLVKCPLVKWGVGTHGFWGPEILDAAYVGVVTRVYRLKADVAGGPDGRRTWDIADLKVVNESR
jgi:hypothetical protein